MQSNYHFVILSASEESPKCINSNYHFVILSASEESPKCINKWEILHCVQDDRAKQ